MVVRNPALESIESWTGYDTWNDPYSLTTQQWVDSSNVIVEANGNAIALRSPANFNTALSTGNPVLSVEYYDRQAGGLDIFDIDVGGSVTTYSTSGSSNTSLRTGQATNTRWQSLNVNNCLYRVNGTEFIQYPTGLTPYAVGITAPAAAPTLSFVAGGSGSLAIGVTVSYAYVNSTTGDVGQCSAFSLSSGVSTNTTLRVAVTASTQAGVDKIALFITEDGGSIRYLLVDSSGNPRLFTNSTGNIDISLITLLDANGNYFLNFSVQETFANTPPPSGITHISRWKNRIMGILGRLIVYSGFDQISYGTPWACWPGLNVITLPNKGDIMQAGVETPLGWLGLSNVNAYLMTGVPSDNVDSGANTLQVTQQFNQLGWGLGTRSPLTLQNCPWGTLWLDQDKKLQFWSWYGTPSEICLGLRTDLQTIQDTDAARAMAEARWFSTSEKGGFFVLTASTTGSTNNRMWIVTVMMKGGQLFIAGAPSDIAAQCVAISRISGTVKCLIGQTDRLREILNFSLAGAGWGATQQLYFEMVAGNQIGIFDRLHSVQFDCTDSNIQIRTSELDGSKIKVYNPVKQFGSYTTVINRYGMRHKVRFTFPTTDDISREVKNCRIVYGRKPRVA